MEVSAWDEKWVRFRMALAQFGVEPRAHEFCRGWVLGFWGFIKPRKISQAELADIEACLRKLAAEDKKMWQVKQAEEALRGRLCIKPDCANCRVDAVKITRIYLSGLSPIVWQPDEKTRQRRELFSAYQAVVRDATRSQQHLKSMLNEYCLRLAPKTRLTASGALPRLFALRDWTLIQRAVLEQIHQSLVDARQRRSRLRATPGNQSQPTGHHPRRQNPSRPGI